MICRSCGVEFADRPGESACPRCAFARALGVGASAGVAGYDLVQELGRGAMGVVWLARERALDRLVALKLIAAPDSRLEQRLRREGQAAARLRHPNIVAVHASGREGVDGPLYLAMEFIEGGNLEEFLSGRPLPPQQAAAFAAQLAGALAAAHAAGILHRDIKPSNILVDAEGRPHLADFGLAGPLHGKGDLTVAGQIAGTPAYLAPELLSGVEASPASDIYGLGAVLYACLTGRAPFGGESAAAILARVAADDPISPRLLQPGIPRDLETICLKCLAKAPGQRYGSAAAAEDDLARFQRGETISARPLGTMGRTVRWCRRRPAAASAIVLAAAIVLIFAVGGPIVALRFRSQLRAALLARSEAAAETASDGQRNDALAAATEAARIATGLDVRNAAIAALARCEIELQREWRARDGVRQGLVFDPDHDQYAVETNPGQLAVHRLSDAALSASLHGPAVPLVASAVFSADGRWIVADNERGEAVVWRLGAGQPAFVVPGHAVPPGSGGYSLCSADSFSPDGRVLAAAMAEGGISLRDTASGRELRRWPTDGQVTHLVYSPDGRRIAVGRVNGFLEIRDSVSGSRVSRLRAEDFFERMVWSADSTRLLVASNPVGLFRASDGKRLFIVSVPNIYCAYFGPHPNQIITSVYYGEIQLADLASGRILLASGLGGQFEFAADRAGTLIAKSSGPENARLFRLEPPEVVRTLPSASDDPDNVSNNGGTLEYSPDGRFIATAIWGEVQLRRAPLGEICATLPWGSRATPTTVRVAPDGKALLVCSEARGLARVAFSPAGELGAPATIDAEPGYQLQVLSADGRRAILTAAKLGRAKVVRLEGGGPPVRWAEDGATRAAFLPGDREVLVNSVVRIGHAPLQLINVDTGEVARTLPLRRGQHVHVSRDGRWILLGTAIDRTELRRLPDWSAGAPLPDEVMGAGHNAAFAPDGSIIAFGLGANTDLVRVADGAPLATLNTPERGKGMAELAFSPDGSQLAIWYRSAQLTLWDLRALRRELAARRLDW